MRKITHTIKMTAIAIATVAGTASLPANADNNKVVSVFSAANGEKQSLALDNIKNIVFEGNNLVLNPADGSEPVAFAIDEVGKIVFEEHLETGIQSLETIGELKFYSPAPNLFAVESPHPIDRIAIYGVDGAVCFTSYPKATIATVAVAALPAGVYLLQVETAKTAVTKKFIKR